MLFRSRNMEPVWSAGKTPKICVVGAGFSGLRCGEILIDGGAEVTIYEASSRIGGRVRLLDLQTSPLLNIAGRSMDIRRPTIRFVGISNLSCTCIDRNLGGQIGYMALRTILFWDLQSKQILLLALLEREVLSWMQMGSG
jgi:heterodisulfide reductase subunit A-like polyferredoxin